MARSMTSIEKQRFKGYFPNLDVDRAVVSGETSIVYNCISWTLGFTDRWIWPGNSLANFDALYHGCGFIRAEDGTIAVWGHSASSMTHGSISGEGHGPRWESKCGPDLRIQHGLAEFAGGIYGRVIAFYRKSPSRKRLVQTVAETAMNRAKPKSFLSTIQRRALQEERNRIPAELQTAYARAFSAWKQTWQAGGLAISSDPHLRAVGKEFDALIALGPGIIPLVIESLSDPENFFALQLYDAIQPNRLLLVQYEPNDERVFEGEQGRAQRVVQLWFRNR